MSPFGYVLFQRLPCIRISFPVRCLRQVAFEDYATEMLKAAIGVTALRLAVKFDIVPSESVFDEDLGLLCRLPGSQAMLFHPSLLPTHQQCTEVFERLKALHLSLQTHHIDVKARAGSESSAKIYPVLEALVTGDGGCAGLDLIRATRAVDEQSETPRGRYNDLSAQAAIALANDVHVIEERADVRDLQPDFPGAITEGPDGLVVNLKEVLSNLPDGPEQVDGRSKRDRMRSWRDGCSSAEVPFRPSDDFDPVLLNLPEGPKAVDEEEKLGLFEEWREGCAFADVPLQELLTSDI
jgi:hypothetical protein